MKKVIRDIILVSLVLSFVGWDRTYITENIDEIQEHAKEMNGNKELPPRDFKTDGCTLWPDSILRYSWQDKCIEHDIRYWVGGSEEERLQADLKLRDDVNKVLPGMGNVIYLGVRLGGRSLSPLIPWPWGWGYGWDTGRKN